MSVVVDTNVIISALYSKRGASYGLLRECLSGVISYAVSPLLSLEYEGKIDDKIKDGFLIAAKEDYGRILDAFLAGAVIIWKPSPARPRLQDTSDDKILECAISGLCSHIITFNKRQFPASVVQVYGIKAVTPGEFLYYWRNKS
jgi:putative PIN family toxin of toxin-antitoxin system